MARLLAREVATALAPADALATDVSSALLGSDAAHQASGFVALRCVPWPAELGSIEWVFAHSTPSMALGVMSHAHDAPRAFVSRRAVGSGPRVVCEGV